MRTFDCPQCGAPVTLRASTAVFVVCEHCRSMVVVRGADVESMGLMAALPPDLSPFQVGTRGEWKGHGFEIVGRVRVEWADGSWNEWCIQYNGATTGWLAEAQGLLMISFATTPPEKLSPQVRDYVPGKQLVINGKPWTVSDVKEAKCRASEGELPFAAPPRHQRTSIDLFGRIGGFASIELSEGDAEVYVGEYVAFDDLKLSNLRPVPGWNAEVAQEKNRTTVLACLSCGAPVDLRVVGLAMSAVCGSCGTVIDTATPELHVIQKADAAVRNLAPLLPVGRRGKLFDVDYEVIGYVLRADSEYAWSEYLLFNPWQGFRWLVSFNGHWSFIERLPAMPDVLSTVVPWQGRDYRFFARSTATVKGVLGEFYWKVRRGEKAEVTDYVAPPYVLSKEAYPGLNEFAWSHGTYVEPKIIGEAFAVKVLPQSIGVYLNQPNPYDLRWKEVRVPFIAALVLLVILQMHFESKHPEVTVAEAQLTFDRATAAVAAAPADPTATTVANAVAAATEPAKTLSTPHFTLAGAEQPVNIQADAAIDNNWLGLDLTLVNAKTNASFPAGIGLSYYHGSDEDGPWTEGSQRASISFPSVPPGEYFLTIEPSADPAIQTLPFKVRVLAGGAYGSNLIVMMALVLFYPAILLWRRHTFERERWGD